MSYEIEHVPDSFAWLRSLESDQVDVILTDPPFNEHVHANMSSGTAMKRQVDGGKGGGIPRVELPFDPLAGYDFAADLVRVARRWVVVKCAVEDFGAYRAINPAAWVRGGIWYKPNSMGQLTGDRPANAYEGLAVMHRPGKKLWNGRGSYAYWSAEQDDDHHFVANGTRGEKERHPNQMPLKLCLELVAKFSNRGETVLDPFCGSGRMGEACMLLGRDYIGLDLPPGEKTKGIDWVARARERCQAALDGGVQLEDAACLRLCQARTRPAA